MIKDEEKLFKWCIPDPIDERDYVYWAEKPITFLTEEEWNKWYRIDKELWITIPVKNQDKSSSCTGQWTSYYTWILNFIETWKYIDVSAKAIYSQVTLGKNKWAVIRDAIKLIVTWWAVYNSVVPSNEKDWSCSEDFIIDKSWLTPEITELAKILQSKDYKSISWYDIETFAAAIKENHWVVSWVTWTNNWTWYSISPEPPTTSTAQRDLWWHCIFFGWYGKDSKWKFIWILNSWWEEVGEKWWQKLYINWFWNEWRWIFNPWTLQDKPNINLDNMTYKQIKGDKNIWACNEDTKIRSMVVDMTTLEFLTQWKFDVVDSLDWYKIYWTLILAERVID